MCSSSIYGPARIGSTAVLTFAPAPRRRSLRGPGPRRTAPPPPFVPAFVPPRVEVSRFVRQSKRDTQMTSMDLDGWTRVKYRLRAEVADDVYASWFARMELDGTA